MADATAQGVGDIHTDGRHTDQRPRPYRDLRRPLAVLPRTVDRGGPLPIEVMVNGILADSVIWVQLPERYDEQHWRLIDGGGWTTRSHLKASHAFELAEERRSEDEARRREQHERNRDRFAVEQQEVTQPPSCRALAKLGIAEARVLPASKLTAFGTAVLVDGRVIVCNPVVERIWTNWHPASGVRVPSWSLETIDGLHVRVRSCRGVCGSLRSTPSRQSPLCPRHAQHQIVSRLQSSRLPRAARTSRTIGPPPDRDYNLVPET